MGLESLPKRGGNLSADAVEGEQQRKSNYFTPAWIILHHRRCEFANIFFVELRPSRVLHCSNKLWHISSACFSHPINCTRLSYVHNRLMQSDRGFFCHAIKTIPMGMGLLFCSLRVRSSTSFRNISFTFTFIQHQQKVQLSKRAVHGGRERELVFYTRLLRPQWDLSTSTNWGIQRHEQQEQQQELCEGGK